MLFCSSTPPSSEMAIIYGAAAMSPLSQGLATVIPGGWGPSLLWICGAQTRDGGSVREEESLRETGVQ